MAQMEQARQRDRLSQVSSLLGTVGLRKAAAIVEATWETAQGIGALARRDFWAAAQHFLTAAEYGVIAGTSGRSKAFQSAVGGAVSGAAVIGGEISSGATARETMAQGAVASERQPTVQIIVQGNIYGGQAGLDQLARELSEAVQERDVNPMACTVVRQPATRA